MKQNRFICLDVLLDQEGDGRGVVFMGVVFKGYLSRRGIFHEVLGIVPDDLLPEGDVIAGEGGGALPGLHGIGDAMDLEVDPRVDDAVEAFL